MFRETIEKMAPYTPGEQPRPGQRVIKLNTNENPVSAFAAGRAPRSHGPRGIACAFIPRRAPMISSRAPRSFTACRRKMILAGNGSDELLAMIFRATLGPGDTVAYPVPTYSLYDTLATIQDAKILHFPVARDFSIALAPARRARAKLTIVCSPNSPSGTLTPTAKLSTLARGLGRRLLSSTRLTWTSRRRMRSAFCAAIATW